MTVSLPELVRGDDPRMVEAGGCLGLAQDAPRRPGGLDHLHCHRALEPPVPASVNGAEPARSDPLEQPESSQRRITHHDAFTLRHYILPLLRPLRLSAPRVILLCLLAFMDEDDSFPPVATEPENHGRPPPERQRVFMARRLGAVVAGILILVLLVLGIRGCLNARKERAFENYARDLSTLVQQSQQISEGFFARFSDPQTELRFETDIRADRSAADGVVSRAESLDPPGELSNAQDDVVEAFQLRADGLGKIADQVGPALGDEDFNEAIEQMTIDMQDFLASDVLYARARGDQRGAPAGGDRRGRPGELLLSAFPAPSSPTSSGSTRPRSRRTSPRSPATPPSPGCTTSRSLLC